MTVAGCGCSWTEILDRSTSSGLSRGKIEPGNAGLHQAPLLVTAESSSSANLLIITLTVIVGTVTVHMT